MSRFPAAALVGARQWHSLGLFTTRCLTNPNQVFNTANKNREWQAKVSGAYNLPYGILGRRLRYPERKSS